MKILFCILLMTGAAMAQKAIEPIRVSLTTRTPDCAEFSQAFRDELRKFDDVAVVRNKPDFEIHIAAAELRDDNDMVFGYVATLLVIKTKSGEKYHSIHTGADAARLARRLVTELDKEFFEPKRRGRKEK